MLKNIIVSIVILAFIGIIAVIKLAPQTANVTHVVNQYVFHREELLKQTNGHTNILLLGIGGGTHDGPDLTDTIIFASIDWKNNKINLVSIPRDLWIPDLQGKINTAYAYGQEKTPPQGLSDAEKLISTVTGQPIHYGFRIDFGGFVKAVDELGGLDINVENTFDDYAYPIEGLEDATCGFSDTQIASLSAQIASGSAGESDSFPCRYKHIHFDKGQQHMDGQTALEYVRSRHALGPEGSDFARSRRQSKVITAVKEKVFSAETFLNPARILNLYNILKDSIDTDIPTADIALFVDQLQKLRKAKIQSGVLDMGDANREGLLINPTDTTLYGGSWVLVPRKGNGDFSEIHDYVNCEIMNGDCVITDTGVKVASSSAKTTP